MESNPDNEFKSLLAAALADFNIETLSEAQINQLVRHYSMLRQWNRRMNLTRIIEPRDAARLHYCESLFGGRFMGGAKTMLDVGSGAGFPAIPLAVLRPDVQVIALEANNKKSLFLNEAKEALGLANFKVATARLEAFDWSSYDLIASRALDRAEDVLPTVITNLSERQRLMIYCAPNLIAKLDRFVQLGFKVEAHPIPQGKARVIAVFAPISQKQSG